MMLADTGAADTIISEKSQTRLEKPEVLATNNGRTYTGKELPLIDEVKLLVNFKDKPEIELKIEHISTVIKKEDVEYAIQIIYLFWLALYCNFLQI